MIAIDTIVKDILIVLAIVAACWAALGLIGLIIGMRLLTGNWFWNK